jgi:sulfite exporter TauE/SafE
LRGWRPSLILNRIMNDATLLSMFLLGLLGTGHCVGMCGPLVLAIPTTAGNRSAHLFYNMGRISCYTTVGALLGGIGAGLSDLAAGTGSGQVERVAAVQVGFSVLASMFLLAFGLVRLGVLKEPEWMASASPVKLPGFARVRTGVTRDGSRSMIFLFGLMMGFLPCGLSYAAFAAALPAGGALQGGALVLLFGLGTLPGLFLMGTAASGIFRRYRRESDLVSGMLMILMAFSLAGSALFPG